MASLATEVSLHCIICFEEFDVKDRPPVILPCGHTYVCLVCAKRLRKCMECREPLYWTPPSQKPAVLGNPMMNARTPPIARYGRGRYGPQTPTHPAMVPPVKEEPVPLPLPKNIVLMGMIEAAERQARLLHLSKVEEATRQSSGSVIDAEALELEGDAVPESKLDPLLAGMSAFVGTCGTYAVREPLGLAVLPFDPNKRHHDQHLNEDNSSHEQQQEEEEKKGEDVKEPFTIEEGQTVQVVGVDEGVYKLARGAGFIVASVNQLVKVGGPLDTSCKYEGMLESVQRKQNELERELSEINYLVHGLVDRIDLEKQNPPEHPVITPAKIEREEITADDENDAAALSNSPRTPVQGPVESPSRHGPGSASSTEVNLGDPRTPAQQVIASDGHTKSPASCPMPGALMPTSLPSAALGHGLSQPFMDGEPAGLPRYRITNDDDNIHSALPWSFGCGTGLFGERVIEQQPDAANMMTLSFDEGMADGSNPRSRPAERSLAARTMASAGLGVADSALRTGGSFDGPINFRTGMSGHTGLNLSRKKSSPMSRPHQVRMMSEHSGIAASAARRNNNLDFQRRVAGLPITK